MPSWKTNLKGFKTFKNNQVTIASGREQNKGEVCELRGNLIRERSIEHKMVTTGQEGRWDRRDRLRAREACISETHCTLRKETESTGVAAAQHVNTLS